MEIMTVKEKKPMKKMGATYNRSHKKEKGINKIENMDTIVVLPDDSESFNIGSKHNTFDKVNIQNTDYHSSYFYPNLNQNDMQSLNELIVNFQNVSRYDVISIAIVENNRYSIFRHGQNKYQKYQLAINVSFMHSMMNPVSFNKYSEIIQLSGILDLIRSSISEVFKLITSGQNNMIDMPNTRTVAYYIATKNVLNDEMIRREFNQFDFSEFSREICDYIYRTNNKQLNEISDNITNTLYSNYSLFVNSLHEKLELASIMAKIKGAFIGIFSGETLDTKVEKVSAGLEDYQPETELQVKVVPTRKTVSYDKLFGSKNRYKKIDTKTTKTK